ncbi:MAG: alpha/beta fold hydrolase [Deltaproteobacteria bacterium]|nr:alpha/beta fold hydrolase [Deltaproteobacteria bacterium]
MPLLSFYKKALARRYETETLADEIHRVKTIDDVRISLKRFLPCSSSSPQRLPILCVPGLGADSHNYDAPAPLGLAPFLTEQGFDTFVVDLRGTGLSKVSGDRWSRICFDDFVNLDLPVIVDKILELTGQKQILFIGHSMGGMILYAAMAMGQADKIAAGITVGAPVGFPFRWAVAPHLRPFKRLGEFVPGLFMRDLSRLLTPLLLRTENLPGVRDLLEISNLEPKMARQLLYQAVQDIPQGVLLQMRDWVENDAFRSRNLDVDYRAGLMGAATKLLVVAGVADKLGPPKAVERAVGLVEDAEWMLCGKETGFSTDYGHADLLLGPRSREEIYPHLSDFFRRHSNISSFSGGKNETEPSLSKRKKLQVIHS